jgi:hypothetical protein
MSKNIRALLFSNSLVKDNFGWISLNSKNILYFYIRGVLVIGDKNSIKVSGRIESAIFYFINISEEIPVDGTPFARPSFFKFF